MCGVLGLVSFDENKKHGSPDMLKEVLAHRGPDRFGYTQVGSCTLWHYRLSVIDPSDQGNQPLTTPCGRYTLIFNGEVYNYRALKKQFNLPCVGKSDSEVVLLLFKALGTESIALLEGMFSFAIWDAQENELTLARDRIGIKPLYYSQSHSGDFVFASEIKGIQSLAPRKPSDEHLSDYLSLGFVPGNNTLFEGVYQVKPGSYVQVKKDDVYYHTFYSLSDRVKEAPAPPKSYETAKKSLRELIYKSVEDRLVADVPLGCFLSGGIDSSLVVAVAQDILGGSLETFSIGFKEAAFNEASHAAVIAKYLGSEHREKVFEPKDLLDIFPNYLSITDQPFGDTSLLPTFLVSKFAREHVTVALSGDGGDEGFMGYGMYDWAKRLDNPLLRFAGQITSPMIKMLGSSRYKRAFMLFEGHDKYQRQRHIFSQEQYLFSQKEIDTLRPGISKVSPQPPFPAWMSAQEKQAYFDYCWYLPDDLLVKVDRASMANSLEVRVPLLDHRMVEFALKLPVHWKKRNTVTKYILKDILFDLVPEKYFNRPKQGFSVPLAQYIKGPLRPWVEQYLRRELVAKHNWVDVQAVEQYKTRFFNTGDDYLYHRIFLLSILHQWLEK